jgi:hypothetical protein
MRSGRLSRTTTVAPVAIVLLWAATGGTLQADSGRTSKATSAKRPSRSAPKVIDAPVTSALSGGEGGEAPAARAVTGPPDARNAGAQDSAPGDAGHTAAKPAAGLRGGGAKGPSPSLADVIRRIGEILGEQSTASTTERRPSRAAPGKPARATDAARQSRTSARSSPGRRGVTLAWDPRVLGPAVPQGVQLRWDSAIEPRRTADPRVRLVWPAADDPR